MPVQLKRIYNISGSHTPEQLKMYRNLIDEIRVRIGDEDPSNNILRGCIERYSDNMIIAILKTTLNDINSGYPKTSWSMEHVYKHINSSLLIDGAIVFMLMREGILQVENQIDFSDSGISIAMFNKSQIYQSWYGMMVQQYAQAKQEEKSAIIPKSPNSGFYSIGSPYSYTGTGRWRL